MGMTAMQSSVLCPCSYASCCHLTNGTQKSQDLYAVLDDDVCSLRADASFSMAVLDMLRTSSKPDILLMIAL